MGLRGGVLYRVSPALCWRRSVLFWRHWAIGSWHSDRVAVLSPVPISGYCAGVGEFAGYRKTLEIGDVRTSVQGGATWTYVWLWR